MKKYARFFSLLLIIVGTFMLLTTRLEALSANNIILITGLLLIVAGILLHIYHIKNESQY